MTWIKKCWDLQDHNSTIVIQILPISFNLSLTVVRLFLPTRILQFMRRISAVLICLVFYVSAQAQVITDTVALIQPLPPKAKVNVINKTAADHFMLQLADNFWAGAPDSIKNRLKGLNRSANVYLMLNKPFRGNDKLAIGIGLGIGTSNMYFEKTNIDIAGTTPTLVFMNADSSNRYKKYKFSTAYLEIPLELRYSSKPDQPNKSVKIAIGLKGGTLLNAKIKGKNLENKNGTLLNDLTEKVASKSYMNKTRVAATARVGYGIFSLFGSYNLTPVFKNNVTADIKLLQVGLTISGL